MKPLSSFYNDLASDVLILLLKQKKKQERPSLDIIQQMLGALIEKPLSKIRIEASAQGKPFLNPNAFPHGPHFNVSHSKQYFAMAICTQSPIGLDIEFFRDKHHSKEILETFFCPSELYRYLKLQDPREQQHYFTTLWTLKEAILKLSGDGLTFGLNQFSINLRETSGVFEIEGKIPRSLNAKKLNLETCSPIEEMVCSFAYEKNTPSASKFKILALCDDLMSAKEILITQE